MINIIFATTFEGVIGKDNKLPWHIKEELNHFKNLTLNSVIVMGRKTFQSLPGLLKYRKHIVLTLNKDFQIDNENVELNSDFLTIVKKYFNNPNDHCFIIGGAKIIALFLPYANNLHVSWILNNYPGNTYLPEISWKDFCLVTETKYDKFIYRQYRKIK